MEKYSQINKSYLYESIAFELENMIINGKLEINEKLPPEKTLSEKFGVSRNILRESLKILRERGLIEVKSGNGIYIVKPKTEIISDMINRFITFGDISIEELYEFRSMLEVSACGLAAEKITSDEIEKLNNILNSMKNDFGDIEKWANDELEFHLLIHKSSKNKLLYAFIKPISNLLYELFLKPIHNEESKEIAITGHSSIIKCLEKKDKVLAEAAMKEHIERSKKFILSNL